MDRRHVAIAAVTISALALLWGLGRLPVPDGAATPTRNGSTTPGCDHTNPSTWNCHNKSSDTDPGSNPSSCDLRITITGYEVWVEVWTNVNWPPVARQVTSNVGGELINAQGQVVDYVETTSQNPFRLMANAEGHYTVNAGFKSIIPGVDRVYASVGIDISEPEDRTGPEFEGLQTITAGNHTILLEWWPADDTNTGGHNPCEYHIYEALAKGQQDFQGGPDYVTTSLSYLCEGLTNGQTYYYVVRAADSIGNEDANYVEKWATPEEYIPPPPPDTTPPPDVQGVDAQDLHTDGEVHLTWTPSPAEDLAGYRVYLSMDPFTNVTNATKYRNQDIQPSVNNMTIGGLPNFRTVYFAVTAFDLRGNEDMEPQHVVSVVPTTPDREPPQVVSFWPADGATEIPIDAAFWARFSEPMNLSSLNDQTVRLQDEDGLYVNGSVTYDDATYTVTFRPLAHLDYSTTYTCRIYGSVTDASENANPMGQAQTWLFSTITAPQVTAVTPADGAVVAFSPPPLISATFSRAMDADTLDSAVTLVDEHGGSISVNLSYDEGSFLLTIVPGEPLMEGTLYTVTITTAAKDADGYPLKWPYQWTFRTKDLVPPSPVTGLEAHPGNQQVLLTWNPTDDMRFDRYLIYYSESPMTEVPDRPEDDFKADRMDTELTVYGLENGVRYYFAVVVRINDVRPLTSPLGEVVSAVPFLPDEVPPSLSADDVEPRPGALNVPEDAAIVVHFPEPMAETFDIEVMAEGKDDAIVRGSLSYNNETSVLTFYPGQILYFGTTYHVALSANNTDLAGNPLVPFEWEFTTRPNAGVVDADLDGIPDADETRWGLDPTDPSDALKDKDGDGRSNLQEYRDGTDPTRKEAPPGANEEGPRWYEARVGPVPLLLVIAAALILIVAAALVIAWSHERVRSEKGAGPPAQRSLFVASEAEEAKRSEPKRPGGETPAQIRRKLDALENDFFMGKVDREKYVALKSRFEERLLAADRGSHEAGRAAPEGHGRAGPPGSGPSSYQPQPGDYTYLQAPIEPNIYPVYAGSEMYTYEMPPQPPDDLPDISTAPPAPPPDLADPNPEEEQGMQISCPSCGAPSPAHGTCPSCGHTNW